MSKLSRFYIGVIVVGLAFIAALNLYRAYERRVQEALQEQQAAPTQTFHQVPVSRVPAEPEMPVLKRWSQEQDLSVFETELPPTQSPLLQQAAERAEQAPAAATSAREASSQISFIPQAFVPIPQEIFLQDATLSTADQKQQARDTIRSILADYRQDPQFRAFYADLAQATGKNFTLADLSGENLQTILKQYPQIKTVMAQHARNPQFAKKLQEVFSNPQFVHSVAVLQGGQLKR